MVLKKNTAESKGMTYGIPALDAVRKFSNEAWLFLAKPLDFLHLCIGEDTVGILEFTIFGPETRGFGNSRIAHVVTLKIVMSKGPEFSVEF
jgi:hypothetical protein